MIGENKAVEEIQNYGPSGIQSITDSWNKMQRHLHCCGIDSYKNWQHTSYGINTKGVPDSCCRERNRDGCGDGMFVTDDKGFDFENIIQNIYVVGCFEILRNWMEDYVDPLIDIYSCVGAILAIIELIETMLVVAYAAHIKRKRRKAENIISKNKFPENGNFLMDDNEYEPTPEYRSSKYESEI